jgi:hypothetical protein
VGGNLDSDGINPLRYKDVLDGDCTFKAQLLVIPSRSDAVRMAYDTNIFRFASLNRTQKLRNLPLGFCRQFRGVTFEIEKKPYWRLREFGKSLPEYFEYLFFLHRDWSGRGYIHGLDFCRMSRFRKELSPPFVLDYNFTHPPIRIREKNNKIPFGST